MCKLTPLNNDFSECPNYQPIDDFLDIAEPMYDFSDMSDSDFDEEAEGISVEEDRTPILDDEGNFVAWLEDPIIPRWLFCAGHKPVTLSKCLELYNDSLDKPIVLNGSMFKVTHGGYCCTFCHDDNTYAEKQSITRIYTADEFAGRLRFEIECTQNYNSVPSDLFCIECEGFLFNVEDRPDRWDADDYSIVQEYFYTNEINEFVSIN